MGPDDTFSVQGNGSTDVRVRTRPRTDVSAISISPNATIEQAIACIDLSGSLSIALIVDDDGRLLNTITDGDVRRGLLAGLALADSVSVLIAIKSSMPHPLPVTAPPGADADTLLHLMSARAVRQIPIVKEDGQVLDVVTFDDLHPDHQPPALQAVVMAGGFGTRLAPLTEHTPKPMLPVDGRPLIEHVVEQLRATGVKKINISTHYRAEQIMGHFGDGSDFGVDISYIQEDTPLGTAGALGLMSVPNEPVLVINGDVLTDIDFQAMHCYHQKLGAVMTVAVRRYAVQVPYGVIESEGADIQRLREKPQLDFFVNAGIYLLEPEVYRHITVGKHLNMTDLIETLIAQGQRVVSFPVREYWLDIGQPADYERAQTDAKNGKHRARVAPV